MVIYLPKDRGVSAKNEIWGKEWYKFEGLSVQLDIAKVNVDAVVNATSQT